MPNNSESGVIDLIEAIDSRLKKVHTQSFDLSFNELLDMHQNGELDISPDYQRLFQWSEGARSRFIESLLLQMPVPPIYVVEEDDGRYVLIDGLQRISSYLHLRGELEADHLDPPIHKNDKLQLVDCDIVTELNGKTYDELGTALQIRLKRAFVRVEVVRKGSDRRFKYHMFKRLNTGGQLLSEQQVRNCTIRLLDPTFNDFIIRLSETEPFRACTTTISNERRLASYDQELVLRFFAFKNYRDNYKHNVADFLTEYMEAVSDKAKALEFDYEEEEQTFLKTFDILGRTLGEKAFWYSNPKTRQLVSGFGVYHYEALTVGLQASLGQIDSADEKFLEALRDMLLDVKRDPTFIGITTGGGKNFPGPLRERIAFVEQAVSKLL
jgi:uncharacterized protein with ParB-like and HNH nuclease domain